ncbi:MAG: murein transglycosylase A [Candidatus Nitrospinota bacterium M3_3B_026]
MWKRVFTSLFALAAIFLAGCEVWRAFLEKPPSHPLVKVEGFDGFLDDDMDAASLRIAAERSIERLSRLDPETVFDFGGRKAGPDALAASLRRLVEIFEETDDPAERSRLIRRDFDVYRGTGRTDGGNVLVTGYFQPVIAARREQDGRFRWPVYRRPNDLITADLGLFSGDLQGRRITGRVEDGKLVPYFDREAIDQEGALSGRGLEVVWADDPVDVFFLQIQGSGIARLENGEEIFLNYAASNGHDYRSIGKLLIEKGEISREAMSLDAIRRWLEENPSMAWDILYSNPSYVFFREMADGPFGATGVKLVSGRSAAFDKSLFPPHALASVSVQAPVVENGAVAGWRMARRFVINHDTGGAIKGPGRMDLFFGAGGDAGTAAGVMKHPGELYFILLKPEALARMEGHRHMVKSER